MNTMTLTGQGQVTVAPDIAVIQLGVQLTGENLTQIQSENARIVQNILLALHRIGVSEIKTSQYTVDKYYEYVEGNRIDRGYIVRNILEIRTSNMDQIGMIIDTAVEQGANAVEFISFEVSNTDFYYQQALNLAILNAISKAKSISITLDLALDPIPKKITENTTTPIPFSRMYTAREGAFTTPIEPGEKRIEASITAEFMY
jgi:uncharacterized protein YggE